MVNKYSTVFALALSTALLFGLAACAPSETPTDNATAPVEAPQDTVNNALANEVTAPAQTTGISDQQITEEVTAALAKAVDPATSTIEVDTQAGVVSLYGEVGSEQDRSALIELISAIDGVLAINTEGLSVAQTS